MTLTYQIVGRLQDCYIVAVPLLISETLNILVGLHAKESYLIYLTQFSVHTLMEASREKFIRQILIL